MIQDLLVGYIGIVRAGMVVPADAILIDGKGVEIDESPITGETEIMKKKSYEVCMIEKE